MSLSGCRPAVVTSLSSRNRLPALGPRLTTSSAAPLGSASTAAAASPSLTSSGSSDSAPRLIVEVCSTGRSGDTGSPGRTSAVPQRAQYSASGGFCCPHRVQNTGCRLLPGALGARGWVGPEEISGGFPVKCTTGGRPDPHCFQALR